MIQVLAFRLGRDFCFVVSVFDYSEEVLTQNKRDGFCFDAIQAVPFCFVKGENQHRATFHSDDVNQSYVFLLKRNSSPSKTIFFIL